MAKPGPKKGSPRVGGRQRGTPNKRTLALMDEAKKLGADVKATGKTPMDVLTFLYRAAFDEAVTVDEKTGTAKVTSWDKAALAAGWAAQCAPFVHAKLQAVESKTQDVGAVEDAVKRVAQKRREQQARSQHQAETTFIGGDTRPSAPPN